MSRYFFSRKSKVLSLKSGSCVLHSFHFRLNTENLRLNNLLMVVLPAVFTSSLSEQSS
jgi:hypothetical protein